MKAGIVGLLDAPNETIDTIHNSTIQEGIEYRYAIEPSETFDDTDLPQTVQSGQAAMEVPEEVEQIEIHDGEITSNTNVQTETKYTQWILIPGELIIVEDSGGQFMYDLLSVELNWEAHRAELDLTKMASDYEETQLWKMGFYDHFGTAQKGVVYGDNVIEDQDIGHALGESQINQLGLQYEYEGNMTKLTLAESGYVELYQPSEFTSGDFAEYLVEEVDDYIVGVYDEE